PCYGLTISLHDALPILGEEVELAVAVGAEIDGAIQPARIGVVAAPGRLGNLLHLLIGEAEDPDARRRAAAIVLPLLRAVGNRRVDRKSTRLNSSHGSIS